MTTSLVVLSQPGCYRCKGVARHLEAKGIDYYYVDVTQDAGWRIWLEDRNLRSVPVTVNAAGEYVEGFDPDGVVALAS